ncbi:MAG: helix-turn-helix domain-containing protein [Promethearchaeota archaeon]
MIQTVKFRIYPDEAQEGKLHELFTIYNRVKRIGYNLLFHGEDYMAARFGEVQTIQQCLMSLCHNNPYVNTSSRKLCNSSKRARV